MNKEILFKYDIQTICAVINSINNATGETIKLRVTSFINLLVDDPFLSATFKTIFELHPFYKLSMKTNDLFPSIDLPNEPIAQIIFVINLMYLCTHQPEHTIFTFICKIYGTGKKTTDFIHHVIEAPLKLLKVRLMSLTAFPWEEIKNHISEILFPQHAFRYLTPEQLPDDSCLEKERLVYLLEEAGIPKENVLKISGDLEKYVQSHNSYHPDIYFLKEFFPRVVKYGDRLALSILLNCCHNALVAPYIIDADPVHQKTKKRGRKSNSAS